MSHKIMYWLPLGSTYVELQGGPPSPAVDGEGDAEDEDENDVEGVVVVVVIGACDDTLSVDELDV